MEGWLKNSIILSLFISITVITDVVLSYFAYVKYPNFFILYEANNEAVLFLTMGNFPFMFVFFHLILILFIFVFMKSLFAKPEWNRILIVGISSSIILLGCSHIFGGLTWFDNHGLALFLLNAIDIVNSIIIGIVILYCFFRTMKVVRKLQFVGSVAK